MKMNLDKPPKEWAEIPIEAHRLGRTGEFLTKSDDLGFLPETARALGTTPDKLLIPPTDTSSRSVRKRRAK
jgi:hypothetical protein